MEGKQQMLKGCVGPNWGPQAFYFVHPVLKENGEPFHFFMKFLNNLRL